MTPDVSIIIPVFDEAPTINRTIHHLQDLKPRGRCEIIVVDGNPLANTLQAITRREPEAETQHMPIKKLTAPCGRGIQMNAGANTAAGRILLFLHADTLLPENAIDHVISVCNSGKCIGGAFDLGIGSDKLIFRIIEMIVSIRTRITRIPYGDQAIFLRKPVFFEMGGFAEIPIMEDIDLMRRIRQRGHQIKLISDPVKTSPRRWEAEGILFCTCRNIMLSSLFYLGVSPRRLKNFYELKSVSW